MLFKILEAAISHLRDVFYAEQTAIMNDADEWGRTKRLMLLAHAFVRREE